MYLPLGGPSVGDPDPRPGPKPKRLYLRIARTGSPDPEERPAPRALRAYLDELDRVGRLVAHGRLTAPYGDLLVFRATSAAAASRILRADPYRTAPNVSRYHWTARCWSRTTTATR